jgi:hypothetical protein
MPKTRLMIQPTWFAPLSRNDQMPKAAVAFKRSDVTRAVRSAHDAGLDVRLIRISPTTGDIELETAAKDAPTAAADSSANEWDANDKD